MSTVETASTTTPSWFTTPKGQGTLLLIGGLAIAAILLGAGLGGAPVVGFLGAIGLKQLLVTGSGILAGVTYIGLTRLNPLGWFNFFKEETQEKIDRIMLILVMGTILIGVIFLPAVLKLAAAIKAGTPFAKTL